MDNSSYMPSEQALSYALPTGTKLDHYIIQQKLGQGSFGITYLAEEELSGRLVVIKENFPRDIAGREQSGLRVLPDGTDNQSFFDWTRQNFLNEARTLNKLSHPNIVNVLTVFDANNTVYFVMPYIGGSSLAATYPPGQSGIPERQLLSLLQTMLDALQHLHNKGLTHRDIKPDNILLNDGTPTLIDFGAARAIRGSGRATQIGTHGYAPPEQMADSNYDSAPKPSIDLYALGATCYYLMSGNNPPPAALRMLDDTIARDLRSPQFKSRYSPATLSSIEKALALKPTKRWQSAQEWLAALPSGISRRAKRNYGVYLTIALLAVAAAAGLTYQYQRHSEQQALKLEQTRKAAEKEAVRRAEQARKAAEEEAARQAEQARRAAEEEAARQAEQARRAAEEEAARQAEQARKAAAEEAARLAEEQKKSAEKTPRETAVQILEQLHIHPELYDRKLLYAAEQGDTYLLQQLLLAGANVNAKGVKDMPPLALATQNGYADCVKLLLTAPDIDINLRDIDGNTALCYAAHHNQLACLQLLLAAPGIDVNLGTVNGTTPLIMAVRGDNIECARALLAAPGIDINKARKDGQTPKKAAQSEEMKELIKAAEDKDKKVYADELRNRGITPSMYPSELCAAATSGDIDLLNLLLSAPGIDVNVTDKKGCTPLYLAAGKGHADCVRALLGMPGINVNQANNKHRTPLYAAAKAGHRECVQLLLKSPSINVSQADKSGKTPLSVAKNKLVKTLLRKAGAK